MLANDFAKTLANGKIEAEAFLRVLEQFVVVFTILQQKELPD